MKIIAGQYRGRNFFMPKGIRPSQGILIKSLFDILGGDLEDTTLLDLFAGSGAVGLEALSRNAAEVTFVEKEAKCSETIDENIRLLTSDGSNPFKGRAHTINADAFATIKALARKKKTYDIVFVDPPYGRGLAKKALKTLEGYDILHRNSFVIIQHEKKETLPEGTGRFSLFRQKKYGDTHLSFFNAKQE